MTKVLEGIRVLDFGRFIACPFAGHLLAQMGAEVIRIERPDGEEDRYIGLVGPNGHNFMYMNIACNKKSITLDITKPRGKEILEELVQHCDVVMNNFSPGIAKALGITYEVMKRIKRDIIFVQVSCFGSSGPYSQRVGFDTVGQVMSGMASITGFPGKPPQRAAVAWVDYSTAISAALGTMFALYHHEKTGEGQMVDLALLSTAITFMASAIGEYEVLGKERYPLGNRSLYSGPADILQAKDGWVLIIGVTNALWRRLCRLLERDELIDDPRLQTDMNRFENREWIDPLVSEWVAKRTVAEVVDELDKARIPCAPVYSIPQVAQDPHIKASKMLTEVDFPGVGQVPVQSPHIRLSETPGSVDTHAPMLGDHNEEVYGGLMGYSKEQIGELKGEGII